jgi:serine/threonine-protein kinase
MSSTGTLAAGTLVAGRYRIEASLAEDGTGAVYRAADTRLDRAVALRALASADAGGAQQGKAAARLVHPNVARVLDFGTDVELAAEFVVADLGTGGSLAALLAQRGAPPLPLALRMIQEAAAGMAAAHRAGLVHGDLHPGVLWLSRDEGRLRVQVLGLGLNPAGSATPRATARYAAPERLRRARDLSSAADVFSLGVIAYEVFAGLPAEWTQLLLQMARGQAVVAPSLLEARPDLPAHVAQAVRRALAADPASRWPDAGDFAAHLIADLAGQAHAETPAVPVPAIVSAAPASAPAAVAVAAPIVSAPAPPAIAPAASAPAPVMAAAAPSSSEATASSESQATADEDADAYEEDLATLAQSAMRALASAVPPADPTSRVAPDPVAEPAAEPVVEPAPAAVQPEPVAAEAVAVVAAEPASMSVEPQPEVAAAVAPVVAEAPVVSIAAAEPAPVAVEPVTVANVAPAVAASEPVVADAAPAVEAIVAEAAPVATIPAPPAQPESTQTAEVPKPARQPLTAGRRGKPIALASTDLADTLYIPPVLEKQARAPAAASAEKLASASTDKAATAPAPASNEKPASAPASASTEKTAPAAPPAGKIAAPPMMAAPAAVSVEPVAPVAEPVVGKRPVIAPAQQIPVEEETRIAAYAPPAPAAEAAAAEAVAVQPAADIPALPERRRRAGMERLGQPSASNRRGLLAASIAVAVIVAGGVVKTLMAGGADAAAAPVQALTSAAATAGGAPAPAQPQAPVADAAVPGAAADSAALPAAVAALTPEEQRKQAEDRRKLEEQRRLQQRQQDSLRQVRLAAQTAQQAAAALPQQVAIQNAPRTAAPPVPQAPAPRLEPRAQPVAAAAPPPAPEPARPAADPNRIYSADELDTRPSLANGSAFRSAVNRTYPGTLRGSNTWGSAVVSFVVMPDGRVDRSSVTVVEASQPAFRGAAAAAIANARFNPARIGGQPVRTTVSMPITWQGGGQDDD